MQHIISTKQFLDRTMLEELFAQAEVFHNKVVADGRRVSSSLDGKILATLFYEPSTRTRFSFEAAMYRLGGSVIATENAIEFSSAIKGESLIDTIRVVASYVDVIVLRHPNNGSAQQAATASRVPIINAGDGSGEHPTQALLDLYTIVRERGTADGITVSIVGDLKYGRTVHSLVQLLCLYRVTVLLVSPPPLALPAQYTDYALEKEVIVETCNLNLALSRADVLYVTRIQKERFIDQVEYEQVKDAFVIDENALALMKRDAIIMHPLPRVNEISVAVDSDKRAAYFRQAENGLYVRMALLYKLLNGDP